MAKMIDEKPSYHGEAKVWDALQAFLPENIIAYNNREINGREFDYCLFIENIGVLVIEVKGWLADKINVQGIDNIIVEGYEKPQRSPKKQSRAYRFALLNNINKKFKTSPLVFDMVCYPFITRAEYKISHLDIVSDEALTIFKEDLESAEALLSKLQQGYQMSKKISHSDFTSELLNKLRQEWEPNFSNEQKSLKAISKPYSILSVYPTSVSAEDIECLVSEYFSGIKRTIFVGDKNSYDNIVRAIDHQYRVYNIEPNGNKLSLGYSNGLIAGSDTVRAFNLEVYYVNDLPQIISSRIDIEEGNMEETLQDSIQRLGEISSFNYEQFLVEHAPVETNTLVAAGAGTGKTYTMVSRVAYLCNKRIEAVTSIADEIAMVTFTNEAAENMKTRIKQMFMNYFLLTQKPSFLKFIEDTDRAHISTIHHFALEIIRKSSLYTGLGTNFRISSNEYLRGKIYSDLLDEFLKNKEEENPNFANEMAVPIYDLKKKIMSVADQLLAKSVDLQNIKSSEMGIAVDNTIPYFNELLEKVLFPAEQKYSLNIHLANQMDLKECIILLEKVFEQFPGKMQNLTFKHLFIDEFQDTDDVQIKVFQMLQKAINGECRMFIVGDLKQSIYRFRGARLSAFSQVQKKSLYEWSQHYLTKNYRTDKRLLDKFDSIFSRMGSNKYLPYEKDTDRLSSTIVTELANEDLLVMIPSHAKHKDVFLNTVMDTIKNQVERLKNIIDERAARLEPSLSAEERTIAVLVRKNWQVDQLVSAAKKRGLRIITKSGGDLYQLPSSIDLYQLVLALNNPSNPLYMVNLIESSYTDLTLDYQKYHGSNEQDRLNDLTRILDEYFLRRMKKTWQQITDEAYTQPILHVLRTLYESLQPWKQFSKYSSEQKSYMANYEYLMEKIINSSRTDTLTLNKIAEYLKVCILTGQKQSSRDTDRTGADIQLICTTVHKSKGLEYGTIILPYTDEDISDIQKVPLDANYSDSKLAYTVLFDNKMRQRNSNYNESFEVDERISEESRILYVALTRAIRNCVWIKNIDSNSAISWGSLLEE